MKKFFLVLLAASAVTANSQIVNMNTGTTNTCAADFYDSGGSAGNYSNNENLIHTFFPATPGTAIQIVFASYTSGAADIITIYDGPDNTFPVLYTGGGTLAIPDQLSSDITGALTVSFTSNAGGTQAGWVAAVSCCSGASTWYADNDGDGFGSAWNMVIACTQPVGYVADNSDCDDTQATFEDLDGDGFGNPLVNGPCGTGDNTDCDDAQVMYEDLDGDNFGNPSVLVACGGVADNTDCDDNNNLVGGGIISTYYEDLDGDGYGTWWNTINACSAPVGFVSNFDDCDDLTITYADNDGDGFGDPAGTVPCGVADNSDCDDMLITYADNDGDNFGDPNVSDPCGIIDNTDCDDNNAGVGGGTINIYYFDGDGDGFGDGWNTAMGCTAPPGFVINGDDCDDLSLNYEDLDGDGFGNPSVLVACGSYDNTDCDDTQWTYADNDGDNFGDPNFIDPCGVADNTDCDDNDPGVGSGVVSMYFADFDGDGFGDPWGWPVLACTAPPGYVANSDDCDDWSITYEDLDGDGFGNPAVQVACGSYDNTDCDDTQMTYADNDGDNFGDPNSIVPCGIADNTDCDDNNAGIGSGTILTFYSDMDADGFGDPWSPVYACTQPVGTVTDSSDCFDWGPMYEDLDGDGFGNPAVLVGCGSWNNIDCDDALLTYADNDGDNFGDPNSPDPCGVADGTDCDDNDNTVGGGIMTAYYNDWDGDGYGTSMWGVTYSCTPVPGSVTNDTDCDDFNPNANPGEIEIAANGVDDNCDGYTDPTVGIVDVQMASFSIYPNPTEGLVFITASIAEMETFQIKIYDLNGRQVEFELHSITNGETIELNLSDFESGIYFINISSDVQNMNYKLIVQ